jgi:hypothetical protein
MSIVHLLFYKYQTLSLVCCETKNSDLTKDTEHMQNQEQCDKRYTAYEKYLHLKKVKSERKNQKEEFGDLHFSHFIKSFIRRT